ncbi:synaptonemal complex protein 3-like [Ostrinia nubilalis]|uniref:synaptonemal complex protein 3-like n=1 Tax=Ostrinia nubilalis TaxID=29057 RepID=UPI0030826345
MSNFKKSAKASKFVADDISEFINESQFLKDSPKVKKTQKRQRTAETNEEEDISKLIGQYQASAKKKKADVSVETCKESRQKLLDVMSHQLDARKHSSDNLLKSLSEVLSQLEADYGVMKDNEQKLEHLSGALIKCMQQATNAHKQKLKALNEIHKSFKKECEEMDHDHKAETDKLADELEDDIKKLQQKLISETKRNGWEALRRSIFHAMQNDF